MSGGSRNTHYQLEKGYSLIEVMIGLVIGMIGVVVILQTLIFSERQKSVTSGTGNSQTDGALAIYSLQRDARQSGHGFNALNALGCSLTLPTGHTLSQLGSVIINPPVSDVPAGDDNTDVLLIAYGNGNGPTEGDLIRAVNGINININSVANYAVGDNVFASPPVGASACSPTLTTVSASAAPSIELDNADDAMEGGSLFNLGATPRVLAYAIRNGQLTQCDFMASDCSADCESGNPNCSANWVTVAGNIVSLRAQYGRDTSVPQDGGIDAWDQTYPDQLTPFDRACQWTRIPVIRLAVVARSPDRDTGAASGAVAPSWDGQADFPITLSTGWQNFRHRTFQTVIPLRNMPWMQNC